MPRNIQTDRVSRALAADAHPLTGINLSLFVPDEHTALLLALKKGAGSPK